MTIIVFHPAGTSPEEMDKRDHQAKKAALLKKLKFGSLYDYKNDDRELIEEVKDEKEEMKK